MMKCWRDAAQVLILQSTPRFYLYHRPSVMSRYACWAAASFRWFVQCRVRGDGMLSHAYHLNQKYQIMITIRMIMMTITITITITIIFIHGQDLENTRALTHRVAFTVATARDLGSLLLTRWHLQDIKVRDRGSDGAEAAISHPCIIWTFAVGNLYIWV